MRRLVSEDWSGTEDAVAVMDARVITSGATATQLHAGRVAHRKCYNAPAAEEFNPGRRARICTAAGQDAPHPRFLYA
jgi:hypothetical protein